MPPPNGTAPARADYSRNPLTYSDPTGEQAIRKLINGGGPFQITAENGFRLWMNRESLEYMLLGMRARVSRGGKLWLDPEPPTQKNNPTAVTFGDKNSGGVHTKTPRKKEGL